MCELCKGRGYIKVEPHEWFDEAVYMTCICRAAEDHAERPATGDDARKEPAALGGAVGFANLGA